MSVIEPALAFVDTNILVYAFEINDSPRKQTAVQLVTELMDENRLRLSTQVLQELYVSLTKKAARPTTRQEAMARLDQLGAWPILTIDLTAIRDAATLSGNATISFWDALIVVAAVRCNATTLYTEDLNHGQQILGVEVCNPFR